MKPLTRFISFGTLIAGISGMLICLPFLFSSNLADLVGAGFPFVGGTILAAGGLHSLSNLAKSEALKFQSKKITAESTQ